MAASRRLVAGTGWKMNNDVAATRRYAADLYAQLADRQVGSLELYVLPPFTSLHAAAEAFAPGPVAIGGQNMHWDNSGAWTGEISAPMLREAGCRYVELAHSERLACFGETYETVRRKLNAAIRHGLTPILCLGETTDDRSAGRADTVLCAQLETALADQPAECVAEAILAYEPRWAIGAAEAASPDYVSARHAAIRALVSRRWGAAAADAVRVVYGGSVTPENGAALVSLADVDGLFVGRAAWTAEGFAAIIAVVAHAAMTKGAPP
jgi:triosephosphate isomerase